MRFAFCQRQDALTLNYIGDLPQKEKSAIVGGRLGCAGCWVGVAGCAAASAIFPPCAPIAGTIGTSFYMALLLSYAAFVTGVAYGIVTRETTQILGDPIFLM